MEAPNKQIMWLYLCAQIAKFMGPTGVLPAPDGPHVGPMNLAIRVVCTFRSGGEVTLTNMGKWIEWI